MSECTRYRVPISDTHPISGRHDTDIGHHIPDIGINIGINVGYHDIGDMISRYRCQYRVPISGIPISGKDSHRYRIKYRTRYRVTKCAPPPELVLHEDLGSLQRLLDAIIADPVPSGMLEARVCKTHSLSFIMSRMIATVRSVIGRPAASARAIASLILRCMHGDMPLSRERSLLFAASCLAACSLRRKSGSILSFALTSRWRTMSGWFSHSSLLFWAYSARSRAFTASLSLCSRSSSGDGPGGTPRGYVFLFSRFSFNSRISKSRFRLSLICSSSLSARRSASWSRSSIVDVNRSCINDCIRCRLRSWRRAFPLSINQA